MIEVGLSVFDPHSVEAIFVERSGHDDGYPVYKIKLVLTSGNTYHFEGALREEDAKKARDKIVNEIRASRTRGMTLSELKRERASLQAQIETIDAEFPKPE